MHFDFQKLYYDLHLGIRMNKTQALTRRQHEGSVSKVKKQKTRPLDVYVLHGIARNSPHGVNRSL